MITAAIYARKSTAQHGTDAEETTQTDPVQLVVGLVVLETDERQGAQVNRCGSAVGLQERSGQVEAPGWDGLEQEAPAVTLGGDIARECVQTVGPPEGGAVVAIGTLLWALSGSFGRAGAAESHTAESVSR